MAQRPLYGIVLAGGSARRLAGADKPMLEVGGIPLLRKAIDALSAAVDVVVVGPRRSGVDAVRWAQEQPPGGGPVAALAAGLNALSDDPQADITVLAADLPGVTAATVARLRAALGEADGAVLVDANGRRQWLTGVWHAAALRAALPPEPAGVAVRETLDALKVVEVPAEAGEAVDVDTPEDLHRARG